MGRMKRIFAIAMVVVMTIGFSVSTAFTSHAVETSTYTQKIQSDEFYMTAYSLSSGVTEIHHLDGYFMPDTERIPFVQFRNTNKESGPYLMRACFMTAVNIPVVYELKKITKLSIYMELAVTQAGGQSFDSSAFSLIVSPGERTFHADSEYVTNFDLNIEQSASAGYGVTLSFDFSNDPIVLEQGTVFRFDLVGNGGSVGWDTSRQAYFIQVSFLNAYITYDVIEASAEDVLIDKMDGVSSGLGDLKDTIVGDPSEFEGVGDDVESGSSDLIHDSSEVFDAMDKFDKTWQDSVQGIYDSLPSAKDPIGSLQGGLVMEFADGTIISRLWSLIEEYKEISIFFTSGLLIVCVYFFLRR